MKIKAFNSIIAITFIFSLASCAQGTKETTASAAQAVQKDQISELISPTELNAKLGDIQLIDIRTPKDMNTVFGIIDKSIGINKIKLCHINDSKKGLGSKLDRHENIGDGEIGKKSIIQVVTFMKKLGIPMILETPSKLVDRDYEMLYNIK